MTEPTLLPPRARTRRINDLQTKEDQIQTMTETTEVPSTEKRRINDLMRDGLRLYDPDEPIPFFCECSLGDCYRAVWLTARDYDGARRDERWHPLANHAQDGRFTSPAAYAAAGGQS